VNKECPKCGKVNPIPARVVALGPLWPFGHWRCVSCGQELALLLVSYYLVALLGLAAVGTVSILFEFFGFERGSLVNAAAMLIVAAFMMFWLPARLAGTRVLNV